MHLNCNPLYCHELTQSCENKKISINIIIDHSPNRVLLEYMETNDETTNANEHNMLKNALDMYVL